MADQSPPTEHLGQQVLESKEHRIWVGGALRTLDGEIPAELTGGRSWNGTTWGGVPFEERVHVGYAEHDHRQIVLWRRLGCINPVQGRQRVVLAAAGAVGLAVAVGPRPARLRVGDAGHRAVAPPRRGVLGERRRRPHRVGHGRRLPRGGRREDRGAGRRFRRQRTDGSHRRRAARDPRRARHPEPAGALLAVAADDHPRHRHRRLDHQRPDHHPRGHARVRPRLRRADRPPQVGLPHRAAERRRVRLGHLAERVVALQRQHQHLVDDERRRGAGLGLPADRHAHQRLLRRAPAGGTTSSPRASWRWTSRPASASGTFR